MQMIAYSLKKYPIRISLLVHLIFLFIILVSSSFFKKNPQTRELNPEIYVPSFLYPSSRQIDKKQVPVEQMINRQKVADFKDLINEKTGLETISKPPPFQQFISQQRYKSIQSKPLEDPVHVIGEKLMDDPLRKLLGVALTKHLIYPKAARDLQLRGVVSIELMLYPTGEVVQIKLIKSSHESLLDVAALNAIQSMSPVHNVDLYLKDPKLLVFNVIFR